MSKRTIKNRRGPARLRSYCETRQALLQAYEVGLVDALPTPGQGITFESLETRQMMSVVNVSDFGARAGNGNNMAAIQAAINSSQPGDTISFANTNYGTLGTVNLLGNRTYQGNGASITAPQAKAVFQLDSNNANSITIEGFNFTGRAIYGVSQNGAPTHIEVKNNSFSGRLYDGGANPAAIWALGWTNSNVENNNFSCWGDGGVEAFGFGNFNIINNQFHDGMEGVHVIGNYPVHTVLNVSGNYFHNMHRMNVELQGVGDHIIVNDNVIDGENIMPGFNNNMDSFGLSIATDGAQKIDVHRNKITSYDRADGVGVRIAIELASDPNVNGAIDCSDNYISGTNSPIAIQTSLGAKVYNNHIQGSLATGNGGVQLDQEKGAQLSNNGSNVALSWDINRAWSGGTGSTVTPTPTPTPTPAPTPTPTPAPTPTPTPAPTPTPTVPSAPRPVAPAPSPATVPAGSDFAYLSDLAIASKSNYWGAVEKDESNGEQATGDGKTLTVNGKTYKKGLGLHAGPNTQVTYNLDGKATTFKTDVGIDDEVYALSGKANVQVWGDGKLLADSGTISSRQDAKSLSVDVTGVKTLTVKVLGINGTYDGAHVDLGYARIYGDLTGVNTGNNGGNSGGNSGGNNGGGTSNHGGPVTAGIFVSKLGFTTNKNGNGAAAINTDDTGESLDIRGKVYKHGIGTTADSKLTVDVGGKYSKFVAEVGLDSHSKKAAKADFQLWADGAKVYDSGVLNTSSRAHKVRVDVTGKQQLWLVVTDASGHAKTTTLANWAGAKLLGAAA